MKKRIVFGGLALLTIMLGARGASAQDNQPAPAPAPAAAPLPAVVRIHIRSYRDKSDARVYSLRPDKSWGLLCVAPCTADAPVGTELRVTMGTRDDEPHSYIVSGDLGPEMDLEVRPASVGPLVGGIVMMGSGGVFVLTGLLFLALADSGFSSGGSSDATKTTGYACVGIGAAAAVGGLVWFLSRSHEPRITDTPHRAHPASLPLVYGRADTLLGDIASARPRDPTSAVPAPFAPVRLGFTF